MQSKLPLMTTNQKIVLTPEENERYWNSAVDGNEYYESQWAALRKKMNNKNYKQWEEKTWKK